MTEPAPPPLRVLVADDQELVRAGFCVILEAAGFMVVGEAADGAQAVRLATRERPDVVLMDVRMPVMDGLAATRQITAMSEGVSPKVVILTTFDLDDYVYEALRAGASGFLLKDAPRADLIAAVRIAAAGEALLAPSVTRRLIEAFARRPAEHVPNPSKLASLTPRERDILLLIARGRTNAEIAQDLFVSETTVKTHVGHLLAKLGLRDRIQAVILAYETGAVVPGRPSALDGPDRFLDLPLIPLDPVPVTAALPPGPGYAMPGYVRDNEDYSGLLGTHWPTWSGRNAAYLA
jgi:DNA-binding NarL/FixJ family response regulator